MKAPEPVAYINPNPKHPEDHFSYFEKDGWRPVYAAPPAAAEVNRQLLDAAKQLLDVFFDSGSGEVDRRLALVDMREAIAAAEKEVTK